jgi:hypothetical protein
MGHAADAGPRRWAERRRDVVGRRGEVDQSLAARRKEGENRGRLARRCRRNRQRWCGWGAWGADRRGTGLFRAHHRGCAGDSCQDRYRACYGRRSVCRAECLQLRFRRWPREECQPQGAPYRTAEALFAASPCAGQAAPAWAMRVCAPFHGGWTDAPAPRQQYRQLLREVKIPVRGRGRPPRQPEGPQSQQAPRFWDVPLQEAQLWLWQRAQRVQELAWPAA